MTIERMEYRDARSIVKPGDVIAFGGKGHFSELIKFDGLVKSRKFRIPSM